MATAETATTANTAATTAGSASGTHRKDKSQHVLKKSSDIHHLALEIRAERATSFDSSLENSSDYDRGSDYDIAADRDLSLTGIESRSARSKSLGLYSLPSLNNDLSRSAASLATHYSIANRDEALSQEEKFEMMQTLLTALLVDIDAHARDVLHGNGVLDKSMLPPSLVRQHTMPLWARVIQEQNFTNIRHLSLRYCALTSDGMISLVAGIYESEMLGVLETLDVCGNEIGVRGSKAISSLIAPHCIDNAAFDVNDTQQALNKYDFSKSNLSEVNVSYNNVSDEGCMYFGISIAFTIHLRKLNLEDCTIGESGVKYLRRGIDRNRSLTELNLSHNPFGASQQGMREIQRLLIKSRYLRVLDLSRCKIGEKGCGELAKGLILNTGLRELRLNVNNIGQRGMRYLAQVLAKNKYLESMQLAYNSIFDEGLRVLSEGIAANYKLRHVTLWYNGIEDAGIRYLNRGLIRRASTHSRKFKDQVTHAVMGSIIKCVGFEGMDPSERISVSRRDTRDALSLLQRGGEGRASGDEKEGEAGGAEGILVDLSPRMSSQATPRTSASLLALDGPGGVSSYGVEDLTSISRTITDFVPIFMEFACDLTHNRRINEKSIDALLDSLEQHDIFVGGLEPHLRHLIVQQKVKSTTVDYDEPSLYPP